MDWNTPLDIGEIDTAHPKVVSEIHVHKCSLNFQCETSGEAKKSNVLGAPVAKLGECWISDRKIMGLILIRSVVLCP